MAGLNRCRFLLLSAFLIVLQIAPAAVAATSKRVDVTWLYPDPSDSPIYNAVDILNATWTSNFTSNPFLLMWCQSSGSNAWESKLNYTVPTSGNRLVPLTVKGSYPAACHFDFRNSDGSDPSGHTISGGFQITNKQNAKPMTWSLDTDPAPVSPSVSASASAGASNSTSTPSSSSAPSGSHVSGGEIAGIVIGGVVALALLGFLSWFLIRRRRQAKRNQILPMHKLYPMYSEDPSVKLTELPRQEVRVSEKDAGDVRYEMTTETEALPTAELDAGSEAIAPTAQPSQGSSRSSMNHHGRSISLSSNGGNVDDHSPMLHPHGSAGPHVSSTMEGP